MAKANANIMPVISDKVTREDSAKLLPIPDKATLTAIPVLS
jgi:hypothetical protein